MVPFHMPLELIDHLPELRTLDRKDLAAFFTANVKQIIGTSFYVFVAGSRIAAVIKAPYDSLAYQLGQAAVEGRATERFALSGKMHFNVLDGGAVTFVLLEVGDQDGRLPRLVRLPIRHKSTVKLKSETVFILSLLYRPRVSQKN